MTESDFSTIFPEETNLYYDVINRYENVSPENGVELFDLKRDSLILADRWNEIYSQCRKGTTIGESFSKSITLLNKWSRERYTILMRIHEDCRYNWRQVNEQEKFFERQSGR